MTDTRAAVRGSPQYVGDPLECALLGGLTSHSISTERQSGWNIDTTALTSTWTPLADSERILQLQSDSSSFSAHVLLSHPFDAVMQRMTVIATISRNISDIIDSRATPLLGMGAITGWTGGQTSDSEYLIASKGSPESILECLSPVQREDPGFRDSYFRAFKGLASQGKRVIAFASRSISCSPLDSSINNNRAEVESNLSFQGFISFECPLR